MDSSGISQENQQPQHNEARAQSPRPSPEREVSSFYVAFLMLSLFLKWKSPTDNLFVKRCRMLISMILIIVEINTLLNQKRLSSKIFYAGLNFVDFSLWYMDSPSDPEFTCLFVLYYGVKTIWYINKACWERLDEYIIRREGMRFMGFIDMKEIKRRVEARKAEKLEEDGEFHEEAEKKKAEMEKAEMEKARVEMEKAEMEKAEMEKAEMAKAEMEKNKLEMREVYRQT